MDDLASLSLVYSRLFLYSYTHCYILYQIDWSEKWLIGLVMFHITCFFLIIVTRRSGFLQAVIFVTLCKLSISLFVVRINSIKLLCSWLWNGEKMHISVVTKLPFKIVICIYISAFQMHRLVFTECNHLCSFAVLSVYFAENLNELAANNWQ